MKLDARARATETVAAKFADKPFSWAGANCIRMARALGVALGHDLPPVPMFRSPLGAKRALAKRGFSSVSAMLDHYFTRLPAPAYALVGDLVSLPAAEEHGLEAMGIADGLGNIWAWHEATDFQKLEVVKGAMGDAVAAWRL